MAERVRNRAEPELRVVLLAVGFDLRAAEGGRDAIAVGRAVMHVVRVALELEVGVLLPHLVYHVSSHVAVLGVTRVVGGGLLLHARPDDERDGLQLQLLQDRVSHVICFVIPVVYRYHHALLAQERPVDAPFAELVRAYGAIAVVLQPPHLRLEHARGNHEG